MEVARLDQAVSQLPNPDILIRPIIRREAVSTSALEGTYIAFSEIFEADFIEEKRLSSEQREVRNYVVATEQGIELPAREMKRDEYFRRCQDNKQPASAAGSDGGRTSCNRGPGFGSSDSRKSHRLLCSRAITLIEE